MLPEEPEVYTTSKFHITKPFIALSIVIIVVTLGYITLQSTTKQPITSTTQPIPTLSKPSISCPVIGFCQRAKPIVNNNNTIAISSNIPTNAPVYAIFDGKTVVRSISAAGTPRETFYSVTLINNDESLKAVYYFKEGSALGSTNGVNVKAGEVLATASAKPMKFFNNNNFAFSLLDKDNQIIPIEKIEFR